MLVESYLWGKLEHYYSCDDNNDVHSNSTILIDLGSSLIRLFEPKPLSGFGSGDELIDVGHTNGTINNSSDAREDVDIMETRRAPADLSDADIVVKLG